MSIVHSTTETYTINVVAKLPHITSIVELINKRVIKLNDNIKN